MVSSQHGMVAADQGDCSAIGALIKCVQLDFAQPLLSKVFAVVSTDTHLSGFVHCLATCLEGGIHTHRSKAVPKRCVAHASLPQRSIRNPAISHRQLVSQRLNGLGKCGYEAMQKPDSC